MSSYILKYCALQKLQRHALLRNISSSTANYNNTIIKDAPINNIGEFYKDACVFITGGTGFLGKALLEKLLRSCGKIDSAYLLMRPKKGINCEQRLEEVLKNKAFSKLKYINPGILSKIKIIEGDICKPNLGMNALEREKLAGKINVIFHSAATVRFNENIKDATIINTLGTKRVLEFGNEMPHLKSFVYVSTAYSNVDKKDIQEIVYKPAFDPESLLNCIDILPDEAMDIVEQKLKGKFPNTYTLTKCLAESIVLKYAEKLPIAIVRPSAVTAAWKEPFPGWIERSSITKIMAAIGTGSIKSAIGNPTLGADLIPVDVVVNTILTAAWHTNAYTSNTMRIYNCTSGQINKVTWQDIIFLTQTYARKYPTRYQFKNPDFSFRINQSTNWIYTAIYHKAFACIYDAILYCTKRKPMLYNTSKKFDEFWKTICFFALNEWNFQTSTIKDLQRAVNSAEDGDTFNIDISKKNGFHWDLYFKDFWVTGVKQCVLRDGLPSLPKPNAKLTLTPQVSSSE